MSSEQTLLSLARPRAELLVCLFSNPYANQGVMTAFSLLPTRLIELALSS